MIKIAYRNPLGHALKLFHFIIKIFHFVSKSLSYFRNFITRRLLKKKV